jgi:hypothetical protein
MSVLTFIFDYSRRAKKFLERSESVISQDKVEESVKSAIKKFFAAEEIGSKKYGKQYLIFHIVSE